MRFWVSRQSDAPLKDQLVNQILLAISSRELDAGAKLPSTRALARRLGIHANTVSAAYKDLQSRGWVELRKGSGVYVSPLVQQPALSGELELDRLVHEFVRNARAAGFSLAQIGARTKRSMELQPPDHLLVVEDDDELRRILIYEIESTVRFPVRGSTQQACRDPVALVGAQPVALYGRGAELPGILHPESPCLWLRVRSVQQELLKSLRPLPEGRSVTIASRWPEFLERGRTMLAAVGLPPDVVHLRDARDKGWMKGLGENDFVITDSVTAASLARKTRVPGATFALLSDDAVASVQTFVDGLG